MVQPTGASGEAAESPWEKKGPSGPRLEKDRILSLVHALKEALGQLEWQDSDKRLEASQRLEGINHRLEGLEADLRERNNERTAQDAELTELTRQLSSVETELARLQGRFEAEQTTLAAKEANLTESRKKIDELKKAFEDAPNQVTRETLQNDLIALLNSLAPLEAELASLRARIGEIQAEGLGYNSRARALRETIQTKRAGVQSIGGEIERLQREKDALTGEKSKVAGIVLGLQKESDTLAKRQEMLGGIEPLLMQLESQLEILQDQSAEVTAEEDRLARVLGSIQERVVDALRRVIEVSEELRGEVSKAHVNLAGTNVSLRLDRAEALEPVEQLAESLSLVSEDPNSNENWEKLIQALEALTRRVENLELGTDLSRNIVDEQKKLAAGIHERVSYALRDLDLDLLRTDLEAARANAEAHRSLVEQLTGEKNEALRDENRRLRDDLEAASRANEATLRELRDAREALAKRRVEEGKAPEEEDGPPALPSIQQVAEGSPSQAAAVPAVPDLPEAPPPEPPPAEAPTTATEGGLEMPGVPLEPTPEVGVRPDEAEAAPETTGAAVPSEAGVAPMVGPAQPLEAAARPTTPSPPLSERPRTPAPPSQPEPRSGPRIRPLRR